MSVVGTKPTGIATYAQNLVAHWHIPETTFLTPQPTLAQHNPYLIPTHLSAEHGRAGHLRRLLWTQFQLPNIYRELRSRLIFSPVPEAPIASSCRYVVMMHDLIPLRFPNWKSPLTYYCRYYIPQVLAQAEHVICNSESTAQDVKNHFGLSHSQITPILLAYDEQNFRSLNLDQPDDAAVTPYFLYIGRHDPYKNVQRLLTAFAHLPHQDCELWLAGPADPRYTPTLAAQADELGVNQRVKFLNYVAYDQLPVLLNRAIALVFPSLWEGFGFPALEAMACGTPVITSNLSSLPEVVGDAAILIDPYNTTEITAAMRSLVEDSGVRAQLHAAGLARASQFSWRKTGQQTAEVLRQFL
nr:glycosyltransferase family 1 protein [Oculatella sp. LEGE 06141]